jgi:hypothetical protein
VKFSFESIKRRINELESVWEPELSLLTFRSKKRTKDLKIRSLLCTYGIERAFGFAQ